MLCFKTIMHQIWFRLRRVSAAYPLHA